MEHPEALPERLNVYQLEHDFYLRLTHLTDQLLPEPQEALEPFCAAVNTLSHGLFQLALHVEERLNVQPTSIPANAIGFPVLSYGHSLPLVIVSFHRLEFTLLIN